MRLTNSQDGKARADVNITFRLTIEEIADHFAWESAHGQSLPDGKRALLAILKESIAYHGVFPVMDNVSEEHITKGRTAAYRLLS